MSGYKGWMPVWLATYLFITGYIAMSWFIGIFAFLMSENGLPCLWYYRYSMAAIVAIPWMWYFMYLGTRYFDRIPRLYYLWVVAPFYAVVSNVLIYKTIVHHVFKFNETTYIISISLFDLVAAGLILFIGYELYTHRDKYIQLMNEGATTS